MQRAMLTSLILVLMLTACGPSYAPPNAASIPCPQISAAAYDAAIEAGAASGSARIHENGMVSLENGPGEVHCATYSSAMRPCRRPNDYVIRYTLESGEALHVRVPAGEQYRFNVGARPTTCQIVNQ